MWSANTLFLAKALGISKIAVVCLALLLALGCGNSTPANPNATEGQDHAHAASEAELATLNHAHSDPAETCFICDADKRDKGRLWCREHARYEDRCWLCHPELEDKDRLYCKEHGLYEDECHLCRPAVLEQEDGDTSAAHKPASVDGLFCNEHGVAEVECAICQPDLAAKLAPGNSMKVRMPSLQAAEKVGIQFNQPRFLDTPANLEAYGELRFNLNQMAKITPLTDGIIQRVHVDVGMRVRSGDPLLTLHSAQAAAIKSAYLTAIVDRDIHEQDFERAKRLKEQQISSEKAYFDAEAAYRTANLKELNLHQQLLNIGLTPAEIVRIEDEQDTSAQLVIRAPFSGTLVDRQAVAGEAVAMGQVLFTLADLADYWLSLAIPAKALDRVAVNQPVRVVFDDLGNTPFTGRITWIGNHIDEQSRMIQARAVIPNSDGRLKAGLFGKAHIALSAPQATALVPRQAVQRHAGGTYVFVPNAPDLFSLRRVTLGSTDGDHVHVVAGLSPQDQVVTKGSFIVMSEFLKSRLGAGCVHE